VRARTHARAKPRGAKRHLAVTKIEDNAIHAASSAVAESDFQQVSIRPASLIEEGIA
jgi:hypothetical protein